MSNVNTSSGGTGIQVFIQGGEYGGIIWIKEERAVVNDHAVGNAIPHELPHELSDMDVRISRCVGIGSDGMGGYQPQGVKEKVRRRITKVRWKGESWWWWEEREMEREPAKLPAVLEPPRVGVS